MNRIRRTDCANRTRKRLSEPFLRQKWPTRHLWTVGDCAVVNRYDIEAGVSGTSVIETITVRVGCVANKTFLVCPECGRRCEHLFRTPGGSDWQCRLCADVIYPSQRHKSRTHPARSIPVPRKRRFDRSDGLPYGFTVPRIPKNADGRDLDEIASRGGLDLIGYFARLRRNNCGIPIVQA